MEHLKDVVILNIRNAALDYTGFLDACRNSKIVRKKCDIYFVVKIQACQSMSDGGGGGMNYNQHDRSVITTMPDALNQKGPTVRNYLYFYLASKSRSLDVLLRPYLSYLLI